MQNINNPFGCPKRILFLAIFFSNMLLSTLLNNLYALPKSSTIQEKIEYSKIIFPFESINLPDKENEMSRRYLKIMERWIPLAMEYFNDWPVRPNCGHFFGGVFWYGIETSVPAFIFALAASSPEYDASITGFSREQLREAAIKGLRYLCFTHDTGPADCVRPKESLGRTEPANTKWGERGRGFFPESQCGGVIRTMNATAAILREWVDAETWQMLTNINLDYVDRFGTMPPRSGVYCNTQLEENGWTSSGLTGVYLFLPRHPNAEDWQKQANLWAFCTVTMPRDNYNLAQFADSTTVQKLCDRRYTTLPDALAENHAIVHPSYLSSGIGNLGAAACLYHLFGKTPPPHLLWHRQEIYDNLKQTCDNYGAPHRVQGMDWPYFSMGISGVHVVANLFLHDPIAAYLERVTLEWTEKVQKLNNGRMIDKSVAEICHGQQDPAIMKELQCGSIAASYLAHRLMGVGEEPVSEKVFQDQTRGVRHFPHAGVLFHKHDRGQVSFSWRNQTMVMPLPSDGLLLIGSARGAMLANIVVKDHPQSVTPVSLKVFDKSDRAAAVLIQDLAQNSVRRKVFFASLPDGNTLVVEQLWALKDITVESLRQGYLQIINEKFACAGEDGRAQRMFYFPEGQRKFYGFPSRSADDDIIFKLDHPGWVNVDDKLSLIFKGTGETLYHNRHYFKVWHAIADDLVLSAQDAPKSYQKGAKIGVLTTLICPDQKHSDVNSNLLRIGQTSAELECIRVGGYLCYANLNSDACQKQASFPIKSDKSLPIFPGTSKIKNDSQIYQIKSDALEAQILETLGSIKINKMKDDAELLVEAVPGGAIYLNNLGFSKIKLEIQVKQKRRELALNAGEVEAIRFE